MRSYVGIDAHCNSGLEFATVDADSGELLWRDRCRMNAEQVREVVRRAPRPCTAVLEQGELATWLYLVLDGWCDKTAVADPRRNRLIAESPDKDDPFDALALAQLARGRYIREVYQPPPAFLQLRHQVRQQYRLSQLVTSLKNQTKALFRQHGVGVKGSKIYSQRHRVAWLDCLPHAVAPAVIDLFDLLDLASEKKHAAQLLLNEAVRRFPPAKYLLSVPEIGPVRAATFVAYIVTPQRFPSKKHLWSYCGFGLKERKSGSHAEPVRLRRSYNRHVKRVIKGAVEQLIIRAPKEPFPAAYRTRIQGGTTPIRAKLTVGRKLINTLCALWRNKEEYDPDKVVVE